MYTTIASGHTSVQAKTPRCLSHRAAVSVKSEDDRRGGVARFGRQINQRLARDPVIFHSSRIGSATRQSVGHATTIEIRNHWRRLDTTTEFTLSFSLFYLVIKDNRRT
jgi:hypothetical protein